MSTQIYNTCKIPTTDMRALLRIAKEIQRIEIPAIVNSLGAKYSLYIPEELKMALQSLRDSENHETTRAIKRAMDRFVVLTMMNDTIVRSPEDETYFYEQFRRLVQVELYDGSLTSLADLVEDVAKLRILTFLPTRHGFTLMKWYNLTASSREWLEKQFKEYDYQNSTDGPELRELNLELDANINEAVMDFLENDLSSSVPTIAKHEETRKLANVLKDQIKYSIAYSIYKERELVWDEATRDSFNYSQSGLSYDLHSGYENSLKTICSRSFAQACKPAAEQDQKELTKCIQQKARDDKWVAEYLKRQAEMNG